MLNGSIECNHGLSVPCTPYPVLAPFAGLGAYRDEFDSNGGIFQTRPVLDGTFQRKPTATLGFAKLETAGPMPDSLLCNFERSVTLITN